MVSQVTLLLITVFSVVGLILRYLPRKTIYWFPGKAEDWIYKLPYLKKIIDDLHLKEKVVSLHKWMKDLDTFYLWLVTLAALGVSWAFLSPIAFNLGLGSDDGSRLRQMILYATGGLVGTMTLVETRRRNEQDHIRQVHAERRSRYAKAIEQLADEKAPIRLGGVYTLAKLVDEWLADKKTLPSEKERRQEGQIIIDSLCAYIRSSFPLTERYDELTLSYEEYQQNRQGNQDLRSPQIIPFPKPKNAKQSREDFMRDKSLLREEQEVRKTVLSEIEKRLNSNKDKNEDSKGEVKPGTWSYFEYDFSSAVFFYPVDLSNSYFGASSKFSKTYFAAGADFSEGEFIEHAHFSEATFIMDAKFSKVTFNRDADFSGATFTSGANFSKANFIRITNFFQANFTRLTNFFQANFTQGVDFTEAEFTQGANFTWATFTGYTHFTEATFTGYTHFTEATFTQGVNISGDADFSGATFTGFTSFSGVEFTGYTHFTEATFTQSADFPSGGADFSEAIFTQGADFSGATFTQGVDFSEATFQIEPIFESALANKARFSCKVEPENYNFEVSSKSPYKIDTWDPERNGIKFTIPKGATLFDPDDLSEQEDNDGS